MTPLWEVLHGLVTQTPQTPLKPYLWKWATMWPWIQEACALITSVIAPWFAARVERLPRGRGPSLLRSRERSPG